MKILHTSDWHIGRLLYGRKRYDEFEAFFAWLEQLIVSQKIDALLVAGDIFDTTLPSNRAQEIYYRFLCNVCASGLRHVVITAGNHDSPSFLSAPKDLLRALNVHVLGAASKEPNDEVIELKGSSGKVEAIVCAVPYLRDRDIRTVKAGESIADKGLNLVKGIGSHYDEVFKIAQEKQIKQKKYGDIPVIGMGHLFAAGGKTIDGDGVRDLYVGSLAYVGKEIFPDTVDYVALGHLHVPQSVGGAEHIRYSGSPIPMGYGEANQEKSVVILDVKKGDLKFDLYPVPCFQSLKRIKGDLEDILQEIEDLKRNNSSAWLEIEYTGKKIPGNLKETIEILVADTGMEIRRIKNRRVLERMIKKSREAKTLEDLSVGDVFNQLLETHEVESDQRVELIQAYQEIVALLHEEDTMAE